MQGGENLFVGYEERRNIAPAVEEAHQVHPIIKREVEGDVAIPEYPVWLGSA